MRGRVAEIIAIAGLATAVTLAMAGPVLQAPSERVFGMEIVGRHHDPFTVMAQFGRPASTGVYAQPITDLPGALLARASGRVAAYNWLVLLSFPFSAVAAFLLARYLGLSRVAAAMAGMAYAFSPFHVAHAAYHPHVAQTQWLPLYFLALWRCLDRPSPLAGVFLGLAAMAVSLSNFYAGLMAAVLTPPAVVAYWLLTCRTDPRPLHRLGITAGILGLIAACGVAYAWHTSDPVVLDRTAFGFPRADLFRYSATWWSYLLPPVAHPLFGEAAQRAWEAAGVGLGLLEHQVSLGWGICVLGLIAVYRWTMSRLVDGQPAALAAVPVLVVLAVAAFVCSLSPEWSLGGFTLPRPSALFYEAAPMFRSYARFGVVVQLMAVLVAGFGLDVLRRAGSGHARLVALALVALTAGEYAVRPSRLWRDVLPTSAHRWVAQQPDRLRVLDCAPPTLESASVRWLTGYRVSPLTEAIHDCLEPELPQKLAAAGYTHLLVRRETSDGRWFVERRRPDGLRPTVTSDDGAVFAVTAETPAVYTATMKGFFPRERDADWTWRWMGADAVWTVANTRGQPVVATLEVELSAFHRPRGIELRLDEQPVQTFAVEPLRRTYRTRRFVVTPGAHKLSFHPAEPPTLAGAAIGNGDPRALSFAVGAWTWTQPGERR